MTSVYYMKYNFTLLKVRRYEKKTVNERQAKSSTAAEDGR